LSQQAARNKPLNADAIGGAPTNNRRSHPV
jgi:hypothetical protein